VATTRQSAGVQAESRPASDDRKLREERLLDAAVALLVRYGYRKTTIDDVAREAGVGKGTVYLHWKDKNELFRAAIWREQQRYTADLQRRIAADPQGGLLHRVTTHGMLAGLANPLMAAMIGGKSDIFNGFLRTTDPGFLNQIFGDAGTYFRQLQEAGLIRSDIPAPVITYMITALKVGLFNAADFLSKEHVPSVEQLTEALSELIRNWLEPEHLPDAGDAGKAFWIEYLANVKAPE
jgi:AcrR family transcriptional regulator